MIFSLLEPTEAEIRIHITLCYKNKLAKIKNKIWFLSYGKELDFSYYDIHTALLNIFLNDSHAILILQGYIL